MTVKYDDKNNYGRLICIAKKHFDIWSQKNIKPQKAEMKLSYMPVIFNISSAGNTNNELSHKSLVHKQAMSRTLQELEDIGMIKSSVIDNDKRSRKINLTVDGEKFVSNANEELSQLVKQYIKIVGIKDFETTINVLSKIVDFHEAKFEGDSV